MLVSPSLVHFSGRLNYFNLVDWEADGCRCGRALAPHGDKSHHLKPPDPDPWPDPFPNGIPERVEDLPTSPGGSYMIPLLPPVLQRQIEAEAERQLAEERGEREATQTASVVEVEEDKGGSRASTPSID